MSHTSQNDTMIYAEALSPVTANGITPGSNLAYASAAGTGPNPQNVMLGTWRALDDAAGTAWPARPTIWKQVS